MPGNGLIALARRGRKSHSQHSGRPLRKVLRYAIPSHPFPRAEAPREGSEALPCATVGVAGETDITWAYRYELRPCRADEVVGDD